ncbi:MAG: MraY family glycosyltransferase [Thermodesulfobacteriota bacterium]
MVRWGHRMDLLDYPNDRSSHDRATPRGAGMGLLAAFVLCALWFGAPAAFWGPAVLVAAASFQNDRRELDIRLRLVIQFSAAGLFLAFLPVFDFLSPFATVGLALFYAVFVVGTANYYNFMDGINGIAAITGIVGFGLMAAYGYGTGKPVFLWNISLGMALACAGFLPFNMPRARVFMGDVGSILLGFVFACVVVLSASSPAEFIVGAGFLFPFYADELITMAERLKAGERITQAHRRHLYQVLANEYGVAHWKVSVGYGMVQLFVGLCVWMFAGFGPVHGIVAIGIFSMAWYGVDRSVKRTTPKSSQGQS